MFKRCQIAYIRNEHNLYPCITMQLPCKIASNEMSQISCQKHNICSLLLSSRYKTNYIKTCSFLHAHFNGTMKEVENLSRKAYGETLNYWKGIYCRYTLELPRWSNSNVYQQYMLLKIRKLVLSLYLNLVLCPLYLPILNISNCQSILEYMSLHHKLFKIFMTTISPNLWNTFLLTW